MGHSPVHLPTAKVCMIILRAARGKDGGRNLKSRQQCKKWAHNGNDVRGISRLYGTVKSPFDSVRVDSSAHDPVHIAMVLARL